MPCLSCGRTRQFTIAGDFHDVKPLFELPPFQGQQYYINYLNAIKGNSWWGHGVFTAREGSDAQKEIYDV